MFRLSTVLLATVLFIAGYASAVEHPVPLEKDADCATCHEDKTKAPHVHSAIAMGCTTCHEVKTEGETTTVNLTQPKEELCFTCHEKSTEKTLHGPYAAGQCVNCHDPHTSENDKQLRAAGNTLCLTCHLPRRTTDTTVQLFGDKVTMKDTDFEQIPKIELAPNMKFGHPMGSHPVADVPDPTKPGTKISCLTCHEQHAGKSENLIRMAENGKQDVCDACHLANDNARMDAAEKAIQEQEAQKQKQQQQAQPNTGKDKKDKKKGASN